MRIVFMGTPEFAAASLEQLLTTRHEVVGVFTQPDKPKGRGYKLTPPPVKVLAQEHAEHRRSLGVFHSHLCEVHPCTVCRTGKQHLCPAGTPAESDKQFFPCRLVDFFNTGIQQRQQFLPHRV